MAHQSLITRWNVTALIVIACGSAATIALDQLWLRTWVKSGIHAPVGPWRTIDLPAGETLVYYETLVAVPASHVVLHVRDADGRRIEPRPAEDENSYALRFGSWSGRALWSLSIEQPGAYHVICQNATYLSDNEIPPDDRMAFFKQPGTVREAMAVRSSTQIVGATITILLGAVLYGMHFRALRTRPDARLMEARHVDPRTP
jgi:hypothetical protein